MTNLFEIASKSWGKARTNQLLLDALYDIFSASPNKRGRSDCALIFVDKKTELITSGVAGEVIFSDFSPTNKEEWGNLISLIFSYSKQNQVDLTLDPNFNKWIQDNGTRLNRIISEGAFNSYWQRPPSDYIGVIEAGFITGNSDPEKIYRLRYSRNKTSYKNLFDVELLSAIARRSTAGMIEAVEDTEFCSRVSYTIRAEIFSALASVGCLTKKAARKIRSDSSEEASNIGITAIANNITKFKNASEVLSQVMDTKHHNSAMYLARTVPKEYLPFMAVCQDQDVRKVVVTRMQEGTNV
jgi:hypothetical protein